MVVEKKINPVKNFFMRIGKRNLIIIGAVVLIGAAVWLNFILFDTSGRDGYTGYKEPAGMTSKTSEDGAAVADSYFASAQVSRQRARDEAIEVLQGVVDNEAVSDEEKALAVADMSKLAMAMEAEANIETLVTAKGFEKCVAIISSDNSSARIIVSGKNLTKSQLAQINEIVYSETNISPANITVTEK